MDLARVPDVTVQRRHAPYREALAVASATRLLQTDRSVSREPFFRGWKGKTMDISRRRWARIVTADFAVLTLWAAVLATGCSRPSDASTPKEDKKPAAASLKVGILHSLSGTMAISETILKDFMLMQIADLNAKGGLLGRPIEAVVVDPASNWPLF